MSDYEYMSDAGYVGRVRFIEEDTGTVYVELQNTNRALIVLEDGDTSDIEVGSVVFVSDNRLDPAPQGLWEEETWVGVVRLVTPDKTIISRSGQWIAVPSRTNPKYEAGNTVEAKDSYGVIEVLSDDPLPSFDFTRNEEIDVSRFKEESVTEQDTGKKITFEDFGGMEDVVERAKDLIEVPLMYRKALTDIGARPIKGVLFTGPPGTGKTMLARIIAEEAHSEFYRISGPEVFTKWFGESEETLRKIFNAAADEPNGAIIFFDEIDSVASARASTSHEASRSVVAQLLTLMDGFEPNTNVIVIAATNRPEDIDPALRRPGRFDWEVNFELPSEQDREAILRASAHRLKTEEDLPHAVIAREARSWSAADLAAIWSEAALLAAKDGRRKISDEDYFGGFERVQEQKRNKKQSRQRDGNT
jgi:transitional endoplasmic reticulum ATPase